MSTTPGKDAGATSAAASAGASADRAEQAATDAATSAVAADEAMRAAVDAAVAAAVAVHLSEIRQQIADLAAANVTEDAHEAEDDAQVTKLQGIIIAMQSQILWTSAAMLLVGAAIGYVLTALVFG